AAMRQDRRLSRALHALLHLDQMGRPATSELIAGMLRTDSAVVRRTMGGLRAAGIVTATKGHGGGWSLAKPLNDITLLSIYTALGSPVLFAIANDDGPAKCLLAQAANRATSQALKAARLRFEESLRNITVADLMVDWGPELESCDAPDH